MTLLNALVDVEQRFNADSSLCRVSRPKHATGVVGGETAVALSGGN
jgi:hypothetical protein